MDASIYKLTHNCSSQCCSLPTTIITSPPTNKLYLDSPKPYKDGCLHKSLQPPSTEDLKWCSLRSMSPMLTLHEPSERLNGPGRLWTPASALELANCNESADTWPWGLDRPAQTIKDDKNFKARSRICSHATYKGPPPFWGVFIAEATLRSSKQNGTLLLLLLHGKSCRMRSKRLSSRPNIEAYFTLSTASHNGLDRLDSRATFTLCMYEYTLDFRWILMKIIMNKHYWLTLGVWVRATSRTSQEPWPWTLWEPKRKCPKAIPTHLQHHVVWSRTLECIVKSCVTGFSIECYFNEFLFMQVLTHDKIEWINGFERSECRGLPRSGEVRRQVYIMHVLVYTRFPMDFNENNNE